MQHRKIVATVLGSLALVLAVHAPQAAAAGDPSPAGIAQVGAAPDRQEPDRQGLRPGIRSYGKGAVRLVASSPIASAESTPPGAGSFSSGIDATHKISGSPMAGSVVAFTVSPDGATAVYIADQDTAGRFELYSTPVNGSASPTKISSGLPLGAGDDGVSAFQITPDSASVVFLADPNAGGGTDDIFSVPIDGSSGPVQLNASAARPVTGFGLTANSTRALFFGVDTSFGSGAVELYSASIGVASSGTQISDVGQGNALGNVVAANFTPNSARAIYAADGGSDDVFQWYSVPITATGPGSDTQLSAALGSVTLADVTPDSATVVYTSDDGILGVLDVFSKPIGGGTKTQLNPAMAGSGATAIAVSPDGTRVGYLADQNTAGVVEVYSAVIGSAGSGTRLNIPMTGTQLADTLNISPDGTTVLYEADQDTAGTFELFGVPIDDSANPSKLHGLTAPDNVGFFTGLGTPIIGRRAVYPVIGASTVDLFSVPFDQSETFTQINDSLDSGDTLLSVFLPTTATWLMAYGIGPDTGGVTRDVFSVPIRAGLAPEQINTTAGSGATGVLAYEITSDENYGVYLQDQDTLGKTELYSRELDSDADTVVNSTDNCRFIANASQGSAVLGQTVTATSSTTFAWDEATDLRFVRGPLSAVATYSTNDSGTLADAGSYTDVTLPAAGAGLYYLFAPDCAARSYQSTLGDEPGRDTAGLP